MQTPDPTGMGVPHAVHHARDVAATGEAVAEAETVGAVCVRAPIEATGTPHETQNFAPAGTTALHDMQWIADALRCRSALGDPSFVVAWKSFGST